MIHQQELVSKPRLMFRFLAVYFFRSFYLSFLFGFGILSSAVANDVLEGAIIARLLKKINNQIDYLEAADDEHIARYESLLPDYVVQNDIDAVQLIIRCCAVDWSLVDDRCNNMLNIAVRSGHLEMVDLLLRQQGLDCNHSNHNGYTPLLQAIARKNLRIINSLLASGRVNVNQATWDGMSGLLVAACSRQNDIVRLLLEYGANVNQEDIYGFNAYWFATHFKDENLKSLLRTYGAIVDDYVDADEHTLLHHCVYKGYFQGIIELMEVNQHLRLNAINRKGDSPLMIAIRNEDLACVKILLREGASIHFQNYNTGETPLHVSVFYNHDAIFKAILEKKPDLEKRDALGLTPLILAMRLQKNKTAQALIQAGANVYAQQPNGTTIFDIAAETKNWDMIEFFFQKGYGKEIRL